MSENIMVVDDEKEIDDLVKLYLQNENFTVFKYYTASDVLRCTQKEHLDMAILDVMLPEMNGFQFCRKIRDEHHFPIIMLTAKSEELGMKNTHFCNSTGLHDSNHYSTVEDISILLQYLVIRIHSIFITVVACLSSSEKPYQLALQGH